MKRPGPIWHFVHHRTPAGESWTWRRLRGDGGVELMSAAHRSFGRAVRDALLHGFQPTRQPWLQKTGEWTTYFPPGRPPVSYMGRGLPERTGDASPKNPSRARIPRAVINAVLKSQHEAPAPRPPRSPARKQRPG